MSAGSSRSVAEPDYLRGVHSTGDIRSECCYSSHVGSLDAFHEQQLSVLRSPSDFPIHPRLSSPSETPQGPNTPQASVLTMAPIENVRVVPARNTGRRRRNFSLINIFRKVYTFLGYGPNNRARKDLVSLIWTISISFIQVIGHTNS